MDQLSGHERYTICILFYINVINYMDRYTIAGILKDIQDDFKVGDDYVGLLQTAFLLSYTAGAPIFGYLGDRYSRRSIIMISIFVWSSATLIGSFTTTYWWFFCLRCFVGFGESCFSTIAPTLIYDVTYKDIRKTMLALFYIATPIGVGFGYVVAARAASKCGHWNWGMRVTPIFAVIGIVLLSFIRDPIRGARERRATGQEPFENITKYRDDLNDLRKNRSYILSTLGFTCVTFVIGAMSWWGPTFFLLGFRLIPGLENLMYGDVATNFGTMGIVTGLIGVPLGAFISRELNRKYPASDPILCGLGILAGEPFILSGVYYANKSVLPTYICTAFGVVLLSTTWTLVTDILLSVVVPPTRSTAVAFQIAFCHAFGDAGSPYVVGVLSEVIKKKMAQDNPFGDKNLKPIQHFKAMRLSMLCIACIHCLGGVLFLADTFFIVADRKVVLEAIENASRRTSEDPGNN